MADPFEGFDSLDTAHSTAELHRRKQTIDKLKAAVADLERQLAATQKESHEATAKLTRVQNENASRVASLQKEVDTAQSQIRTLKDELAKEKRGKRAAVVGVGVPPSPGPSSTAAEPASPQPAAVKPEASSPLIPAAVHPACEAMFHNLSASMQRVEGQIDTIVTAVRDLSSRRDRAEIDGGSTASTAEAARPSSAVRAVRRPRTPSAVGAAPIVAHSGVGRPSAAAKLDAFDELFGPRQRPAPIKPPARPDAAPMANTDGASQADNAAPHSTPATDALGVGSKRARAGEATVEAVQSGLDVPLDEISADDIFDAPGPSASVAAPAAPPSARGGIYSVPPRRGRPPKSVVSAASSAGSRRPVAAARPTPVAFVKPPPSASSTSGRAAPSAIAASPSQTAPAQVAAINFSALDIARQYLDLRPSAPTPHHQSVLQSQTMAAANRFAKTMSSSNEQQAHYVATAVMTAEDVIAKSAVPLLTADSAVVKQTLQSLFTLSPMQLPTALWKAATAEIGRVLRDPARCTASPQQLKELTALTEGLRHVSATLASPSTACMSKAFLVEVIVSATRQYRRTFHHATIECGLACVAGLVEHDGIRAWLRERDDVASNAESTLLGLTVQAAVREWCDVVSEHHLGVVHRPVDDLWSRIRESAWWPRMAAHVAINAVFETVCKMILRASAKSVVQLAQHIDVVSAFRISVAGKTDRLGALTNGQRLDGNRLTVVALACAFLDENEPLVKVASVTESPKSGAVVPSSTNNQLHDAESSSSSIESVAVRYYCETAFEHFLNPVTTNIEAPSALHTIVAAAVVRCSKRHHSVPLPNRTLQAASVYFNDVLLRHNINAGGSAGGELSELELAATALCVT